MPCTCCRKELKNISICLGCCKVYYCSRECQGLHWRTHRGLCKFIGDMLLVSWTFEAEYRNTLLTWRAMANFVRHYACEVDCLAVAMLKAAHNEPTRNWIQDSRSRIAVIYLRVDEEQKESSPTYKDLVIDSSHVQELSEALDTTSHGSDGTYLALAADSYSISVPTLNIGIVILGHWEKGELDTICYHDARAPDAAALGQEIGVDAALDQLKAAVANID